MSSLDDTEENSPTDIVTVNAGGTRFQTTRTTLEQCKYFKALKNFAEQKNKEFFVDRDPDSFRQFLSLLRLGPELYLQFLSQSEFPAAVRIEATFFQYGGLSASDTETKQPQEKTGSTHRLYRHNLSHRGPPYMVGEMFIVDDETRRPRLATVTRCVYAAQHVYFHFVHWADTFDTYLDYSHYRIRRPATLFDTDNAFVPALTARQDVPSHLLSHSWPI